MRHKMVTASVLAVALSALVFGAAAQRSQQDQTAQQSNPNAPSSAYCGAGAMGLGMMGPGMMGYGMMGGDPGTMMRWGNRPQQSNLNLSASDVKGYRALDCNDGKS